MRKGILTLILIALTSGLYAQQVQVQGNPHMIVQNKGGFMADSAIGLPHTSGNSDFYGYGDIRINDNSHNLEYKKSGQWVEVGQESNNYYQRVEEFDGEPVGTGSYSLSFEPSANTTVVSVNGVELPSDWIQIINNKLTIIKSFYRIDSTDKIKVKYSYHN